MIGVAASTYSRRCKSPFTGQVATQLVITTQPAGATTGVAFTTQPVLQVRDAQNVLVSDSVASVTVSKASGSGTLSGTLTKVAVAGVVTFTDLVITGTGAHTLQFTASGLTTATSSSFTVASASTDFPLTVSSDSRWIQRSDGSKFNINGEANWSLFAELTQAEATAYFTDRAAKGVNLVMASFIEHKYTANTPATRNANGDLPFTGTVSGEEDFTTPNSAYWSHVDWIINEAARLGIVVLAVPCYVGFQHSDQGWSVEMLANGTTRMTTYGTFLGNRYASFPNLIWCMGGDWGPTFGVSNVTTHINNLANAIKAVDTVHLMTAHPEPTHSSFDDYNQGWLDLNAAYPGTETIVHIEVRSARQQVAKPTFMLEARYGNEPSSGAISALSLRTEMYQSILGGGCGHIYGNAPQWYDGVNASHPANSFAATGGLNYASNFNSFEADKLTYVGDLQNARDLSSLTPDYTHTKVTAGYDPGGVEGVTYAPVLASSNVLVAYVRGGSGQPLTVNKAQFTSGTFTVRWYNVRAGTTTSGGTATFGSGTQVFTAPDANDWVLLADLTSLALPDPGVLTPAALWNSAFDLTGYTQRVDRDFNDRLADDTISPTWYPTGQPAGTINGAFGGAAGSSNFDAHNDATAPFQTGGNNCCQMKTPAGWDNLGTSTMNTEKNLTGTTHKSMFIGLVLKCDTGWQGAPSGIGKQGFVWTSGSPSLFYELFGSQAQQDGGGNITDPGTTGTLTFKISTQIPNGVDPGADVAYGNIQCTRGNWYAWAILLEGNETAAGFTARISQKVALWNGSSWGAWQTATQGTGRRFWSSAGGGFEIISLRGTWGGSGGPTCQANQLVHYNRMDVYSKASGV